MTYNCFSVCRELWENRVTLITCLDFESTGTSVTDDRIVEVAAVMMELESGDIRLQFERRCNPGVHIPAGAVEIHGITDADVMKAPAFSSMAGGLVKLIERTDLLVWHNGDFFDGPLLLHELNRVGIAPPNPFPPTFDTMLLGRGCTSDGKVPSLGELCFALDVEYDPIKAHGALYDVAINLQAFRRGWELGYFKLPTS
jgi:DNA polymerase III subunit epsilon